MNIQFPSYNQYDTFIPQRYRRQLQAEINKLLVELKEAVKEERTAKRKPIQTKKVVIQAQIPPYKQPRGNFNKLPDVFKPKKVHFNTDCR